MKTFTFALGDFVYPKTLLEVELAHFSATGKLMFCSPSRVVGRYHFESEAGIDEMYHVSCRGEIGRYFLSDLEPSATVYRLWTELFVKEKQS